MNQELSTDELKDVAGGVKRPNKTIYSFHHSTKGKLRLVQG